MFWVMFWTFIISILAIVLILPWIFIALLPFALLIGSFCLLCVFPIVRRLLSMREDTQTLELDITQKSDEIDNQAILTVHRPLELGTKDQDTNLESSKKDSKKDKENIINTGVDHNKIKHDHSISDDSTHR